jgi:hypothetical protein
MLGHRRTLETELRSWMQHPADAAVFARHDDNMTCVMRIIR